MYCACHDICTKGCACHEICTLPPRHKICTRPRAAQRLPRAPQLIQDALRTAPATKSARQVHQVLRLPRNLRSATRSPAAPTRAAADPGHSAHCACHKICIPGSPSTAPATKYACQVHHALRLSTRGPWAQLIQEALCTAPATKSAHQALRLPRNLHSRFTKRCTCHDICAQPRVAQRRPPAPRLIQGGFASHKICTPDSPSVVPATKSALGHTRPSRSQARRS